MNVLGGGRSLLRCARRHTCNKCWAVWHGTRLSLGRTHELTCRTAMPAVSWHKPRRRAALLPSNGSWKPMMTLKLARLPSAKCACLKYVPLQPVYQGSVYSLISLRAGGTSTCKHADCDAHSAAGAATPAMVYSSNLFLSIMALAA